MQVSRLINILLALAVGLLFLIVLIVLFYLTQAAFAIWNDLQASPIWFQIIYLLALVLLTAGAGWILWRLLMPANRQAARTVIKLPTEAELEQRLMTAAQAGMDVAQVRRELEQLRARRAAGQIYVSLFGEISTGKSSLIKALLPTARVAISPVGGTTRLTQEYHWATDAGDELVLIDVPGTNEVGAELDPISRAEAQRAHLVVYVCDGDLSRSQWDELQNLLRMEKPCLLVLNKTDRYTSDELKLLKKRLQERLQPYPLAEVIPVQAGGMREALRLLPDGREEMVLRPLKPQVSELQLALQRRIDENPQLLEQLRDSAVFSLIAQELDEAEVQHRRVKADELVESYARKAVIGALAAVAPGSDLLIQGYLGVSLIKALSELYQVPVHKTDRERLLDLVQQQVGKSMTLVLAVAGNALKAFPGVGTLAGGALHAVAYGLIFRSLGRAVARSFETRGALHPVQTAQSFKETLGEELDLSAGDVARMALRLTHEHHEKRE